MANKKVSFRKRVFLNPVSTDETSYIHSVIESSRDGEKAWGTNMITIADCHRRTQLEFFLGDKTARRRALKKINLLISHFTDFRTALAKEIELIDNHNESE
jgi:hypothetical protein